MRSNFQEISLRTEQEQIMKKLLTKLARENGPVPGRSYSLMYKKRIYEKYCSNNFLYGTSTVPVPYIFILRQIRTNRSVKVKLTNNYWILLCSIEQTNYCSILELPVH